MAKKFPVTVPFKIADHLITEYEVVVPGFEGFAGMAQRARDSAKKDSNIATLFRSERIKSQVTFIDDKGGRHSIDSLGVLGLPIVLAKAILLNIDGDASAPIGEVVSEGDGISKAIRIRLGTPLEAVKDHKIEELEFFARTYGDLENVLIEDNAIEQSLALIKNVAKPVGGPLLTLPSAAISKITIQDGFFIMEKVLPGFLE